MPGSNPALATALKIPPCSKHHSKILVSHGGGSQWDGGRGPVCGNVAPRADERTPHMVLHEERRRMEEEGIRMPSTQADGCTRVSNPLEDPSNQGFSVHVGACCLQSTSAGLTTCSFSHYCAYWSDLDIIGTQKQRKR